MLTLQVNAHLRVPTLELVNKCSCALRYNNVVVSTYVVSWDRCWIVDLCGKEIDIGVFVEMACVVNLCKSKLIY